jgi:sensor histidine kinase YesM
MFHSITELSPETEEKVKARFVRDEVPSLNLPPLARLVGVTSSGSFAEMNTKDGVVLGYAPVENLNWIVGINIPPQVVIDRIINLALITIISGFVLSLVAAIVAVVIARSITHPISKLAVAAQNVEEDLPFEPEDIADVIELGDELGHLARVFSAMVLALRARMAELRTIYEIGQKISAGVDFEETLLYILSAIHDVIPYDMAELGFYNEEDSCMVVRAAANYESAEGEDAISYYEPETARF